MGVWIFGYDQLNRLTSAANTSVGNWGTNFCWAYDSFGNRLAQSTSNAAFTTGENGACNTTGSLASSLNTWASYNRQNQVTGTTAAPGGYGYDGAGDVIYDGANGYLYDAEGRICAVTNGDGWTGYLYDAAGNRVAKGNITNPNGTCDITSNGFTPTAGYVVGPSGEQLTEVAWVSGGWNQWKHTNVYAGGKLIGTYDGAVAAPTLHFHIDDPLGTRRAQVSSTGVLEATYQSLPFGDGLNSIPYTNATDPTENHFTGKERDAESGNDYMFARYYNSATGRFLSPDPKQTSGHPENPQSWNRYAYTDNNPLEFTDPDGEEKQLTIYVEQPVPNSRAVSNGPSDYGHAFIGLRDTDTMSEDHKVGFYPENKTDLIFDRSATVPGVLKSDKDSDWTVKMTVTISDDAYATIKSDINTQAKKAQDYNMQTNNCANWVVNEAGKAGVNLPQTKGKTDGRQGLDPGDLGQDLREKYKGKAVVNPDKKKDSGSSGSGSGS
jgi:RHS repeat-associated protein